MKRIVNTLNRLEDLMSATVERREETYKSHSEQWQYSEKGEEYMELTDRLHEMLGDVRDWMDELSE